MDELQATGTDGPAQVNSKGKLKKDWAIIKVNPRQSPTEPLDVHVGVNGKTWVLQRGKLVPVPMEVTHALDNSRFPVYAEPDDENESIEGRKVKIGEQHRYPYETIARITEPDYMKLRAIALKRDLKDAEVEPYRN
jgi:hypothetical protein